jgi:hypothetical protein
VTEEDIRNEYQITAGNVKRGERGRETFDSAFGGGSGLNLPQRTIDPGMIDQLFVCPRFHDGSGSDDVDSVSVTDGGEPVRDHNDRSIMSDP